MEELIGTCERRRTEGGGELMMSEPSDIHTAFREFSLVAAEFCDIVDSASALNRVELLSRL